MRARTLLPALLALGFSGAAAPAAGRDLVAVRAGTIFLVENDEVIEGGGTLLVQGDRIVAVGKSVDVPADARVIDYGPDAVIVPGLVAAYSRYAAGIPSARTAAPGLRGIDGFDFSSRLTSALIGGVTAAYVMPAEGRLIAGVGSVVKTAGEDPAQRVLDADAAIHAAIDDSARHTRGYWEPPLPVTSDRDMGWYEPQLPRTTPGALVALNELVAAARARAKDSPFGPTIGADLGPLVAASVPWRVGAELEDEIRAALRFARDNKLPLILDKALEAGRVADEIAASGTPVIFHVPFRPNAGAEDHGRDEDAAWPRFDVPAALARKGVKVAIACDAPSELLFAAALGSRGGLSEAQALRAITLAPAEMLGAAERVGSLRAGKDADFVVLNARPLALGAGVVETWIGGVSRWDAASSGPAHASRARGRLVRAGDERPSAPPTVLSVDELHVGDGSVLRPGEVLLQDGRIAQVGTSVGRPGGARVVHGRAAMPGMIDAFGHLGLEGSRKVPGSDFELSRIVAPGDRVDRRVAAGGITTVVLSPRRAGKDGTPMMAYKPAAQDFAGQVVGDPVALLMDWTDKNRLEAGKAVRAVLEKAVAYDQKWKEYEQALAKWTPPASAPEAAKDAEKDEEAKKGDESKEEAKKDDEKKDEKKDEDKGKDDKKGKKKKKDEPAELEPDPITGVWEASLERPPRPEPVPFKMRVELVGREGSARVWGNLRSLALSATLVAVEGYWDREERSLELTGLGDQGWIELAAKIEDGKLVGTLQVAGRELALKAERSSREFVVAGRSALPAPKKEEAAPEPKGKPREPKVEAGLEPLRAAMRGRATVVVWVEREDEILACVDAFEKAGIRPVLIGASEAWRVKDRLRGRVAGVLLSPVVVVREAELGTDRRTPYAELAQAGIPVAFGSDAEEGAVDLPLRALYAAANGLGATGALRALTADAARMFAIDGRVGRIAEGLDADVLLLDGPPLDPATSVVGAWVNGRSVEEEL